VTIKQRYRLIVKKGPNPGHTYPIFAERITIGRDPMSDIIFKDPEVSRRHAQFARANESYQVEDLGSTNGTFVNGERLSGEPTLLRIGQEIALGGAITLIFDEEDHVPDLELLGTINANLSAEASNPYPEAAEADDSLADFMDDDPPGTSELDGSIVGDEEPHIDQLQSIPALSTSHSSEAPKAQPPRQSAAGQSAAGQPAAGQLAAPSLEPVTNLRAMTTRQITLLIIGTALTTIVCCGTLLLFMYFIGGDWLLNQF
jgi:predicted component of type VI protein secretion system